MLNNPSKELPPEVRKMVPDTQSAEKLAEAWKKTPLVAKLWTNEFKRKEAGGYVLDAAAVEAVVKAVDTAGES